MPSTSRIPARAGLYRPGSGTIPGAGTACGAAEKAGSTVRLSHAPACPRCAPINPSDFAVPADDIAIRRADAKRATARAALYARVSTKGKGQDLELQLEDLRRKAAQQGWTVTEYSDEGWSGGKAKRPALDTMMADVHAGKIDVVCVWRFDRFARSLQHLVGALNEFRAVGVEFVSMHEQIDTRTPMGEAMFHIIAAMAHYAERGFTQSCAPPGLQSPHRTVGFENPTRSVHSA